MEIAVKRLEVEMIKVLGLCGLLLLFSGIGRADAIVLGSGSLANMPSSLSNPTPGTNCGLNPGGNDCGFSGTGPYWDNVSGDGNQLDIGYFLTKSGGFSITGCAGCTPTQYFTGSSNPNSSAPSLIDLTHTSSSSSATLLMNDTADTSLVFGYYNASNTTLPSAVSSEVPLFGPGSLTGSVGNTFNMSGLTSGENYGFYVTRNCVNIPSCTGTTTWFSNDALDTTDIGDQHFVIFTSSTTGVFYIGLEDYGLSAMQTVEGNGDFNDIVVQLNTTSATPEPATFALIGAGLLGLGLARRARRAS